MGQAFGAVRLRWRFRIHEAIVSSDGSELVRASTARPDGAPCVPPPIRGGNARLRFRSALGSLYESQAALRLAAAWGTIDEPDAERIAKELEAFGGRLYG